MKDIKYYLAEDTIDNNDIDKLIEWLKTYPRLTKGKLTVDFEKNGAIGLAESIRFFAIPVHRRIY